MDILSFAHDPLLTGGCLNENSAFDNEEFVFKTTEHNLSHYSFSSLCLPYTHLVMNPMLNLSRNDRLCEDDAKKLPDSLGSPFDFEEKCSSSLYAPPVRSPPLPIYKGTTTLGFVTSHGIFLACDSRASYSTFIASSTVRKIIPINSRLLGTMAGGAADCSYWERHLSRLCRLYELRNREVVSAAAAANILSNIFFRYSGYGLSAGVMIAGWDNVSDRGQLYYVDDGGAHLPGHLFSIGSGSTYAYGVLDSGYTFDLTVEEATELCLKAIYHATHRDGGSGGVCRIYYVFKDGWKVLVEGQDCNELHYKYAKDKSKDPAEM